jgi:hypothetical protein
MLKEKAGMIAGEIWNTINENGALDIKALKKFTKETEKDLYLGLGWLLREDKIFSEDNIFNLK